MMGFYGRNINGKEVVENVRTKAIRWGEIQLKFDLINCPKCGSNNVKLRYVGAGNIGGWRAICSDCLYLPDRFCITEKEAIDLWNGVIT